MKSSENRLHAFHDKEYKITSVRNISRRENYG